MFKLRYIYNIFIQNSFESFLKWNVWSTR